MIKKLTYGLAAASFAALLSTTAANAKLIDDFINSPQGIEILGPATAPPVGAEIVTLIDNAGGDLDFNNDTVDDVTAETGSQLTILGGYRDVTTSLNVSDTGDGTRMRAAVSGGLFSHAQDPSVGSKSVVTWDGSVATPLLNADLTDGGTSTQFHIIVTLADLAITWSLELFDGTGGSESVFFSSAGGIASATNFYIPFLSWATISFNSIDKIIFSANVDHPSTLANEAFTLNVDTKVALIETVGDVPEPASLTLLGAGLMGLGYFGKRRRTRYANA